MRVPVALPILAARTLSFEARIVSSPLIPNALIWETETRAYKSAPLLRRVIEMLFRRLLRRSTIGVFALLLLSTAGALEVRTAGHGRIEHVSIHSNALAGNLVGDPIDQT